MGKERRDWNDVDWSRVIFTDESAIDLLPRRRTYVRRPNGTCFKPKYTSGTKKCSLKLMM